MIYVGIDVASHKHDCYIMSDSNSKLSKLITINNDLDGYVTLKKCITATMTELNDLNVRIGLESTGFNHAIQLIKALYP